MSGSENTSHSATCSAVNELLNQLITLYFMISHESATEKQRTRPTPNPHSWCSTEIRHLHVLPAGLLWVRIMLEAREKATEHTGMVPEPGVFIFF